MSLSMALQSALSGLTAASRGAAVVSDNVSNALTPGYSRQSLELASSPNSGSGVHVVGITRHDDPVLTANRRLADAGYANTSVTGDFFSSFEGLVGTANDPYSVASRLASLESSLIAAASAPDSKTRLDQVAASARALTGVINDASAGVQDLRSGADKSIGQQIDQLNSALREIETLNARIPAIQNSGGNISAFLDRRQSLIDKVNEIIPVKAIERKNDQISLYSSGGAVLLDGRAAQLTFSSVGAILPHMTVDNGLLSGLEINGTPVRTSGKNSPIYGGSLAALFEVRDDLAVEAQADLDTVARDLMERFETSGLDPTLGTTDPGLFTDGGNRFDPGSEIGLAGRIQLNSVVDPNAGGESWKLRDGLGAVSPGEQGDARLLNMFSDALTDSRTMPSLRFGTGGMSAADISGALLSKTGQGVQDAAGRVAYTTAVQTELQRIEGEQGVDTDVELQDLMRIEQSYAANARMLRVVDELMDTLLGL